MTGQIWIAAPMPLLSLWTTNKEAVDQFSIEQVVATAGDGSLRDQSPCSLELRDYLSQIPTAKIASYAQHCLSNSFNKSGMVLQDLINELGKRLDFDVKNGRYQGTAGTIGFDGLWLSPEGHAIVAEVKTTDSYRISLDTLAEYRSKLIASDQISMPSSVLIVVGRQDTGELEAQIRGSRHAWDIRLISVEALLTLVRLKENTDGSETSKKIRSILAPMEYTRLDNLIEIMFSAASDVEVGTVSTSDGDDGDPPEETVSKDRWQFTDSGTLQTKREQIALTLGSARGTHFIRRSRAMYRSSDHQKRMICAISKRYVRRGAPPYWYAYHPQWDEFLKDDPDSVFVLGCVDLSIAFSIPRSVMQDLIPGLNTTGREGGSHYWHIHISEKTVGQFAIPLPKKSSSFDLTNFKLNLNV